MRKRCRRQVGRATAPMLVVWQTIPALGITEHLSVHAIRNGTATTDHFDNLADCRDILAMAAEKRQDEGAIIVSDLAYEALTSIKQRHAATNRLGATGEELKALVLLVETSEDFWKRQSGATFSDHYLALKTARKAKQLETTP